MAKKNSEKNKLKKQARKQEAVIHNMRYSMDTDLQRMKARIEEQKEMERLAEFTENAQPGDVFVAEGLYEPTPADKKKEVVIIGGGSQRDVLDLITSDNIVETKVVDGRSKRRIQTGVEHVSAARQSMYSEHQRVLEEAVLGDRDPSCEQTGLEHVYAGSTADGS